MADITISMRLFGSFRKFGETVNFKVSAGSGIEAVKQRLSEVLAEADAGLIRESALANDNAVLDAGAVFMQDSRLAILPPVCGG
jgi:hypothetical protein